MVIAQAGTPGCGCGLDLSLAAPPPQDRCQYRGSPFLPDQAQGLGAVSECVSECLFTPGIPYRLPSKP